MYIMTVSRKRQDRTPRPTELGRLLRAKREHDKLTVRAAAETIGIEHGSLSELENGLRRPEFETLVKIHETLKIPLDDLLRAAAEDANLKMTDRSNQDLANALADRAAAFPDLQKVLRRLEKTDPKGYRSFLLMLDVYDRQNEQDDEGRS